MDPPIYMYYKLTHFYQNHRMYVKSRDDSQLVRALSPRLGIVSWDAVVACIPVAVVHFGAAAIAIAVAVAMLCGQLVGGRQ